MTTSQTLSQDWHFAGSSIPSSESWLAFLGFEALLRCMQCTVQTLTVKELCMSCNRRKIKALLAGWFLRDFLDSQLLLRELPHRF